MATYQTQNGLAPAVNGSANIPKPTGLAVGDTMIAFFCSNGSSISAHTPPAGWISLVSTAETDRQLSTVYSKTADAADVAASTYTFSSDGSSLVCGGIIARLTNVGVIAGTASGSVLAANASNTFSGFTPSRPNTLFLFFVGLGRSGSSDSAYSSSSVSIATDNPSWTKQTEYVLDVVNETHALAFWTATRSAATATGNLTHTYNDTGSTKSVNGLLVAISDTINGSITPTTKIAAYAFSPISETEINAVVENPETGTRHPAQWTNTPKDNTDWTSPNK